VSARHTHRSQKTLCVLASAPCAVTLNACHNAYVKARTPARPEPLGRIRLTPLLTRSIQAWTAGMANVRPPQLLDSRGDWQVRFNPAVVAVLWANGFSSAYSTHPSRSPQLACGSVLRLLV
jgi:hypothetical protein